MLGRHIDAGHGRRAVWLAILALSVTVLFRAGATTPALALAANAMGALVGFVLFHALPTVRALQISFTDWNLLRPPRDVGWANYQRLWHDERFWHGMQLSLGYALMNIPLQTVLGLDADGHLLLAWSILWAIGFAAMALFADSARQAARRLLAGLGAIDWHALKASMALPVIDAEEIGRAHV